MKFFMLFFVLGCFGLQAQNHLIPSPKTNEMGSNRVEVTSISIKDLDNDIFLGAYAELLHSITGLSIKDSGEYTIQTNFERSDKKYGAYYLHVEEDMTILTASDYSSMVNGFMTLLQLFEIDEGKVYLNLGEIGDFPDFGWRGMHLDVSRHFYNVDEVKRMLDLMAVFKLNRFHWHLTDDQGWRIEIDKYPLLHKIGGFRDSTLIGHYSDNPERYDSHIYGGYYTKEEIKEIIIYADALGIMVIPEIEMPGHSRAALAAYPQYSCTGDSLPVAGTWGVFDDIYCSKKETIDFLKDVLEEVIELFPSPYIHIGGDEAPKERWKQCSSCQTVIKDNGLKDEHELQSYFIKQMDSFLTAKGKILIGWDEILEGGLSPNAVVMSWRGVDGGVQAAKQGHYTIMTPTTFCYFDYYQSAGGNEPVAIGGFLPLDKVFQFKGISSSEEFIGLQEYMLGGQANLWTEYIGDLKHLEYMAYPRLIALAENLWNSESIPYLNFLENLASKIHLLDSLKVNYSSAFKEPIIELESIEHGLGIRLRGPKADSKFQLNLIDGKDSVKDESIGLTYAEQIKFLQTSNRHKLKLEITGDFNGSRILEMNLHKALGAKIEFITQPHPKYSNNGSLNLVDGVKGRRPWIGNEWLGFDEKEVEFYFDFEEKRIVDTIRIGYMKEEGQWIYLPKELVLYTSKNGKKWKKVANYSHLEENQILTLGIKTKYLKFKSVSIGEIPDGKQGAGNTPWTFIDEIEMY